MTVPSYESISTMFSRLNNLPKRKYVNIFFLSTRCLSLERGIDFHLGRGALDTLAGRQVTARRAVSARRLSWSFPRGRTVLSTRRVPAAFEARDPGSASPRLTNPRKPSVPAQVAMPPTVENSTGADAPAAQKEDAPKRKREPNARVVRSPRRPARHARPRARAARRPAASFDRAVPLRPQSAWFPVVSVVSGF